MAITPIDRTLRLLTLLAARLLTPLFPPLPSHLTLKRSGRQAVVGLDGPVTISRDRLGIPTIHAQDTADLFFGFGYAMAQDRLW
ncbi:MAG: penicillin acylase family protein, partial [Candidatus Methylomirabilales bacterium]